VDAISIWAVPLLSKELPTTVVRTSHEAVRSECCPLEGESLGTRVGIAVHVQAFDRAFGFDGTVRAGVADEEIMDDTDTLAARDADIEAVGLG
jgi:hypothetical protein